MSLSRKHFRDIAEALADVRPPTTARSRYALWLRIRDALARVMRAHNSNFQRSIFDEWSERGQGDLYFREDDPGDQPHRVDELYRRT